MKSNRPSGWQSRSPTVQGEAQGLPNWIAAVFLNRPRIAATQPHHNTLFLCSLSSLRRSHRAWPCRRIVSRDFTHRICG